jgi:t-SNARE complex subunit (syntaxin)
VLDRIDYNIEATLSNTKKANKHLVKAREYQESSLARKCMYCETVAILILLIIVVFKYT